MVIFVVNHHDDELYYTSVCISHAADAVHYYTLFSTFFLFINPLSRGLTSGCEGMSKKAII